LEIELEDLEDFLSNIRPKGEILFNNIKNNTWRY